VSALLIVLVLFGGIEVQPQPAQCVCMPRRQFSGGIVDAARRAAYLANADRGITAVALETGAVIWKSDAATLPIGFDHVNVVALRRGTDPREAQVVFLDQNTGAVTRTTKSFRQLRDPNGDRMLRGTSFSAEEAAGIVTVRWRDITPSTSGPQRDTGPTLSQGGVQVSADGGVRELPVEETPRDAASIAGTAYQRGAAHTAGAWTVGACSRALFLEQEDEQLDLMLDLGAPAGSNQRRSLLRARSLSATVSLDGCHVLVETNEGSNSKWTVYSSLTGDRIATIPRDAQATHPSVIDGRAYYLVDIPGADGPRTLLRAVDLESGRERWALPVRHPTGRP
jgi:hypothetical protein